MKAAEEMKREELIAYDKWLTRRKWGTGEIISPEKAADLYLAKHPLPPAEGAEQRIRVRNILQDFYRRGEYELEQAEEDIMRLFQPQPTAEGAEEILESIVESLGEPINIHNHIFEIRPYTVEHKTEWWIFHKEVGSGEPLAQWLQNFATLHAQRIADKMVEEKMRRALINLLRDEQVADTYGVIGIEDIVDEYLKTRDSHESV